MVATTVVAIPTVVATTGSNAIAETFSWQGLPSGDETITECVAAAEVERPDSWVCIGDELTSTSGNSQGEPVTSTRLVADNQIYEDLSATGEVGVLSHDYDSWCENGSKCTRKLSVYIVEVKGNAAYGNRDGVIGTFDIIWHQNFNGPYPRWRLALDWDSGPTVTPFEWKATCRRHVALSEDAYCDSEFFYPGNISSGSQRKYSPSASGFQQGDTRLTGGSTRKYHDDLNGEFSATGYQNVWRAGTLHTGRWNNCGSSTGCKYYQVPWTSSP